jgi:hypothetical protein
MRAGVAMVLVVAAAVGAAPPSHFRYARPVTPPGAGPSRLALDPTLLAAARPLRLDHAGNVVGGLEDLRLFDTAGTEVPYLLVAPILPTPRSADGHVLPVLATKETSGFEVDLGSALPVDRVQLGGIVAPFLKRARLEGSGDREHWVLLADETTVFDLPEEDLRRTEIAFDRQTLRYLRVTWDDRSSARVSVPATVVARVASEVVPAPPERVPLVVERRPSEPGTSRFRVRLPGAHLPIVALELECGGSHLLRRVRVTEPRLAGGEVVPQELGAATLRRAVRDDLVASDLRVAIAPPGEPELELVVDDGDNPPLELTAVSAELATLPWIYFESAAGGTLTARFGDASLSAPRYDLEAVRERVRTTTPQAATWGGLVAEPEEPAAPAGPNEGMPTLGAPIDVAAFRWVRALPSAPAGLTAVVLDAAVLSHSPGLADVRVVDGEGRQIPYVVERVGEPTTVELPAPERLPAGERRGESRYRLAFPYERLPAARLVIETTGRVFDRRVSLLVEGRPADARAEPRLEPVRGATWRHTDPDSPAPPLALDVPPLDGTSAILAVDDGDNEALPILRPRLLLPTYRLRFVRANETPLSLAYGAHDVSTPRYDIALLAPRLLGASAREIVPAPEKASVAAAANEPVTERGVFWGALALAVVGLLVVLVRLLRPQQPAG